MVLKTRQYDGPDLPWAGRGNELPETAAIREVLTESAEDSGRRIELFDLDDAQVARLKARIPVIAAASGMHYRTWPSDDGLIVAAMYKESATPEPPPPAKRGGRTRRATT